LEHPSALLNWQWRMKDKKHGGTSLDAELDDYWKNKEDDDPTDKGQFCNSRSVLLSPCNSGMVGYPFFIVHNPSLLWQKIAGYVLLNCCLFVHVGSLISFSYPSEQMTGSC